MWTQAHRARQEQRSRRYPTDLTDTEWILVEPLLPRPAKRGRRRHIGLREVLDAIRYLARTGCGWRMLPNDFPPWRTVYWWFRRLVRRLLFRTIHDLALMLDRELAGRPARTRRSSTANRSRRPGRPSGAAMPARRSSAASATSPSMPTAAC